MRWRTSHEEWESGSSTSCTTWVNSNRTSKPRVEFLTDLVTFVLLADRKELPELYLEMVHEAETNLTKRWINAAVWKWCDLDAGHDRSVSRHELFPIRANLLSLESCIAPFFENCDTDDDHRITLKEWGKCLEVDDVSTLLLSAPWSVIMFSHFMTLNLRWPFILMNRRSSLRDALKSSKIPRTSNSVKRKIIRSSHCHVQLNHDNLTTTTIV